MRVIVPSVYTPGTWFRSRFLAPSCVALWACAPGSTSDPDLPNTIEQRRPGSSIDAKDQPGLDAGSALPDDAAMNRDMTVVPIADAARKISADGPGDERSDPGASLLNRDVLHLIEIEVAAQDLQMLITDRTKRVMAALSFDGQKIAMVTAHRKGKTTGSSTKPSLVVDLDDLVPNQNLVHRTGNPVKHSAV